MKKRILSMVLVICMMFTLLPGNAFAAETGSVDGSAADIGTVKQVVTKTTPALGSSNETPAGDFLVSGGVDGTDYSYADNILKIKTGTALTISGTTTADRIVVQSGITANITFSGVDIRLEGDEYSEVLCTFDMSGATVNLTLVGTNLLISDVFCAGLRVPSGATLTITDASTGSLNVKGGTLAAGIGGGSNDTSCGTININGGTVTASGGRAASGIGGSDSGAGGTVSITGGNVNAVGYDDTSVQDIGHGDKYGAAEGTLKGIDGVDLNRTATTVALDGVTDAGIQVTDLTVTYNSTDYAYSTAGMKTMADGKLYLWLPTGATVSEVIAGNKDYIGSVTSGNTGTLSYNGTFVASVTTSDGETTNYNDFATALSAAQGSPGSTLKLLSDVTYSGETSCINITSTMTWDLNGCTLTMDGANGYILLNSDTANLTMQDSSTEGNGKIISSAVYVISVNPGTLKITGGTYESTNSSPSTYVIHVDTADSTVVITGGEFKHDQGGASVYFCDGNLNISGGTFHNCVIYFAGKMMLSGGTFNLGLIVNNANITLNDLLPEGYCYYDANGQRYTPADDTKQISQPVTVGEIDWSKAITYNESTKTYTVSSADGLRWIAGIYDQTIEADTYQNDPAWPEVDDFSGCIVRLNADIDLSGKNWKPIACFSGTFDGAGHSITNMKVNENACGGFIVSLNGGATVKNLSITGSVTIDSFIEDPYAQAGGIAASVLAAPGEKITIENCVVDVNVSVNGNVYAVSVGGLVGFSESSSPGSTVEIQNCHSKGTVTNSATVSSGTYVGNLVGEFNILGGGTGMMTNCYAGQSDALVNSRNAAPVLTSVGTYDANGTLTASDGSSLDYGSDLKTAMKNWVLRQGGNATNFVTWTTDAIPAVTTTYATAHSHHMGEWIKQADGTYIAMCTECGEKMTPEACVTWDNTETPYGTLEEALIAAQINSTSGTVTVKLQTDITTETPVIISSVTIVIDLNGKKWNSMVMREGENALTLEGTCHVTLKDSVGNGTISSTGSTSSSTISVRNVSATIESGTYNNTGKGWALRAYEVKDSGNRVIIKGGTFKNSYIGNSPVNIYRSNTTITGGTFERGGIFFNNCKDVDVTGGTFAKLQTYTSEVGTINTVGGLLGDGYAYAKTTDGTLISDVSANTIADITVKEAPVKITAQPQNVMVDYGYGVRPVLSMTAQKAEGVTSEVTYQWYQNNTSITGETGSSYTVESDLGAGTYSYTCVVTCDGFTVSTSPVTVTVKQATGSITNKNYPVSFIFLDSVDTVTNPTASNFTFNVPEENIEFIWYKGESTDDSQKISGLPKDIGTYTLKVAAAGNENVTSAEYTMKVVIKYLETGCVAKRIPDKEWYNQADFNGYVCLNTSETDFYIRLDENAFWCDEMSINKKILDSNGKIKEGLVEVKYQLKGGYTQELSDFKSSYFNIDVTAPTIDESSISYSENHSFLGWLFHNTGIQVTVPVSDAVSGADYISYVLTPDGGTPQAAQTSSVGTDGNAVFTVEKNFKGTIAVTAYDKAGNASSPVEINKMFIEDTAPTLTVNDGTNAFTNQWYTTPQTLHLSAADAGGGIKSITYSVDGQPADTLFEAKETDGSLTQEKNDLTIPVLEGEHTYVITVTDQALNTALETVTLKQDTVKPELTKVVAPTGDRLTHKAATVSFTAGETGSFYYTVQKSGTATDVDTLLGMEAHNMTADDQNTISLNGLDPNSDYTLHIAAKDVAGNKTAQVTTLSFKTAKTPLTTAEVTLADSSFVYNGTSQTPAVTVKVDGVTLDASQYVISYLNSNGGADNTTNAGTVTMTITAADSGDFFGTADSKPAYVIEKGTLNTVGMNYTAYSGTYDGTSHNAVESVTGHPEGSVILYSTSKDYGVTWSTYGSDVPQLTDAGSILVNVMITRDNYQDLELTAKTATVAKKSVTVTASDLTRKYMEKNPEFTLESLTDGLLEGNDTKDVLNVTLSTRATETSDAGTYEITGTSQSNNYDVTVEKGTLTVTQLDSIITIAEGKDKITKTFGDAAFSSECTMTGDGTLSYRVSESKNAAGEVVADDQVITVDAEGNITIHRAGTALISLSVAETKNYKAADTKTIAVTVKKVALSPGMPDAAMKVAYSFAKVSDVTLPVGWIWKDSDKDKALVVEAATAATAIYNGSDKGNYEKESVAINITRSANHIESYTISGLQATYSYTGAEIRPTILLWNGSTQVATEFYKVSYQNNINVGTATAIITGINGYVGTITKIFQIAKINASLSLPKTVITKTYGNKPFSLDAKTEGTAVISYETNNKSVATVSSTGEVTLRGYGIVTITVTAQGSNYNVTTEKVKIMVKPKTMVKPKGKSSETKKIKLSWKKDGLTTGYQIRYSTSKKFTIKTTKSVTIKSYKTLSKKVSGLKSGKKYYVQIRAYKKSGTSNIYSSWSKILSLKAK